MQQVVLAWLAAAALLVAPAAASAQEGPPVGGGFDAHGFVLAAYRPDLRDPLAVQRPAAFEAGDWFAGGLFEYAKDPLVFVLTDADGERIDTVHVLDNVFALDASAGVAAHERLRFDVSVPLFLTSTSDGGSQGVGLGDARLAAMIVAARPEEGRLPGVALVPYADVPTGDATEFLGTGGAAGGARVATTWEAPRYTLSADLGLHFQRAAEVRNLDASDAFTLGLAAGLVASEQVGVTLETRLAAPLGGTRDPGEPAGTGTPAEVLLSTRYVSDGGGVFTGGLGAPLSGGAGAAAFRIFVGGGFGRVEPRDADADGIVGDADACPEAAETRNAFRDEDGCPDGPSPVVVRALGPDGAPVADAKLAVTTPAGPQEHAGTAELSLFPGESVTARATGRCLEGEASAVVPEEGALAVDVRMAPVYESRVLFVVEDEDGKPMSGVNVVWWTEDGCMASDSLAFDGHLELPVGPGSYTATIQAAAGGYLPVQQTFSTTEGRITDVYAQLRPTLVKLEDKEIKILDKVYFETGKAVILPRSFGLLDDVAQTILANPQVGRVEVGGHTDSQGPDAANLDLSQRRAEAVVLYLVQHGIDGGRLIPKGYGETMPVASNQTKQGMAENRRVEFQLVDRQQAAP